MADEELNPEVMAFELLSKAKVYIVNDYVIQFNKKKFEAECVIGNCKNEGKLRLALKVLNFIPERYINVATINKSGNICIEFIDSQVGRTIIEVMNANQLIVHDVWHWKGASQKRTVIEWE